jgi:hypothetical protein
VSPPRFKAAVNRTIRAGIGEAARARAHPAPKTMPHSFGFMPGIDLDKLGQFADEIEPKQRRPGDRTAAPAPQLRRRVRGRSRAAATARHPTKDGGRRHRGLGAGFEAVYEPP